MSSVEGIFSLRFVIADFYMEKPVPGLDTCYSEFRGKEIKRVPVIRIFGSTAVGQKTCMHVHGVFPYFYIPYDQKDFDTLNQAIYQIALNIDKAINISLSQGSSSTQHVFKVQLVKGIPFYGYHRADHHFLKIYMFNPRFVRRAANLLQNGAILNRNFNPHESHVPYILQFMIDYNLYGMSFLHCPLEIVKFRRSKPAEEIIVHNVHETQIIDCNLVKKITRSSLEVDIGSNFILNRFQLIDKTNVTHTNPGIESIWNDERLRRQKLAQLVEDGEENLSSIPPLEIPCTQDRPIVPPTESEIFYRKGLISKLLSMETSNLESTQTTNQTLNSSIISNSTLNSNLNLNKQQKRTFNLTKILQNFVYPEECTQNNNLINASFIPNHLNNNNIFEKSLLISSNEKECMEEQRGILDESIFMEDTVLDEQLVLSLTQSQYENEQQQQHVPLNATLREEDKHLLDILQQLEEDNENKIDLDSSLAPLSQNHKNFVVSPEELDKETTAAALQHLAVDSDSEDNADSDENLNDFSIALENIDDLILKLTQSQKTTDADKPNQICHIDVAQIDGADDFLKTPSKSVKTDIAQTTTRTPTTPKNKTLTMSSSCGSPRTSKIGRKYAPLPLISRSQSVSKNITTSNSNDRLYLKRDAVDRNSLPRSLRKNLALSDLRRKTVSVDTNVEEQVTALKGSLSRKRSKILENKLDKTHITCSLTPHKTNEKCLKVYSVEKKMNENKIINNIKGKDVIEEKKTENIKTTNYKRITRHSLNKREHGRSSKAEQGSPDFQNDCTDILTKTDLNKKSNPEECSSYRNETGEEIVKSHYEAELSLRNVRKTPNLKRHRHSFISSNSSNFNYSTKDKRNKKTLLKMQNCKVMLRRIEKCIKKENISTKIKGESEMLDCSFDATPIKLQVADKMQKQDDLSMQGLELIKCSTEAVQTGKASSDKMVKNNAYKMDNLISAKEVCKTESTSSEDLSASKALLNEINTQKDLKNFSHNLDNLQEASKLHLQSAEKYESANLAPENLRKTASFESSDDEITETPPQRSEKVPRYAHLGNKSLRLQSPALFTQSSSPVLLGNGKLSNSKTLSRTDSVKSEFSINLSSSSNHSLLSTETKLILTPLDLPPSREDVLNGCRKFQLPEYEYQQPFYSNPDDITKQKELCFTVLQLPGNKLNDVEEFQSILGTDFKGLTAWRRDQLMLLGGVEMLNKYRNTQSIREYFCNQKSVIITPYFNVPTRQEAKLWLKARELLKTKEESSEELTRRNFEEDSPIKIRRQKVTMMLNAADDNDSDAADNSLDCTSRSLTLTPLTPATPMPKEHKIKEELKKSFTPVTRNPEKTSLKRNQCFKKRNNCRVLKRISVNKQLKEIFEKEDHNNSKHLSGELPASLKDGQESTISGTQLKASPNFQNNETSITSETALAEMERSSFLRHLKEFDATASGFTENSTLNNTFGFKVALENLQQAKSDVEFNYLTIVTLEVFVATREDLYPNPELDEICCLFYAIENSIPNDHYNNVGKKLPSKACGYILVHDNRDTLTREGHIHGIDTDIEVTIVQTEVEAFEALLNLCSHWDPDIYAGYEIEMSSWGFVIERAKYLCLNIAPLLSRVPTQKVRDFVDEDRESFTDLDIEMKICGRILLDVWRLLRSEIALTSYSFENVMYHILHKRCPWHSYRNLTEWFASPCSRWIVIEYYLERVRGTLAILDQLDLLGRTSEMAKLIGIQFYEVLSRGSQFRVESMMLRIAKPKNLVSLSPSVQQRAHMRAPEYLPLIMEPQSRFYADPLIVLDFQSLYPSMIIAYNYCFSTCLGRVEHLGQSTPFEFGASQLHVSPVMLRKLIDRDLITISPCGAVFVKSCVREGILPRMLTEILDTRQMVKQSMKLHKSNSALKRILHSRQLGLKLMANVTYGYTAANFSGRMPAVEVGDSVVSKGRETLERAIKLVEANDKWNVKVVYGDTDSMFVLVPGRNREEAFRIGEEIAEAVTQQNPHPVKLKLEKVYQPCILQTKKRYVGYMYETPDQKEAIYEAKGIETVRRDGCPAVAKMLEKVLRILFECADVSQVKRYVLRQFTKLLSGRANIQDLIFAKEFRGLNGYRPTACVPALELTRKWIQRDPRRIPRRGERVPFIIISGPPGVPLIRLVRHPHEVLSDEGLKINAVYYITKAIIPPLNRCLLLIGADVNEWFANLPRKVLLTPALSSANEIISYANSKSKKSTISQFFSTTNCITDCGRQTKQGICMECSRNSTRSVIILQSKISKIERSYLTTQHICQACCGRVGDLKCDSLDCPVMYVLHDKRRDLQQIMHFRNLVEQRF